MAVSNTNVRQFAAQGYTVARGLFSLDEVARLRDHYARMNREKHEVADRIDDRDDPLHKYPRIMMPHRWDETSMEWMIDERLKEWLTKILGREPYAVQTMFYFKPPGARGQGAASGSVLFTRRPRAHASPPGWRLIAAT